MKIMRGILMVATTMALTITLLLKNHTDNEEQTKYFQVEKEPTSFQPKKANRFLAEYKNPRAADHCNKDNEICYLQGGSATSGFNHNNSTCCNNKCVDFSMDNQNCGACKNKCEYTEACCKGKCVNLAYDKRHCGSCNNRCDKGLLCIYGMCDYP